MALFNARTCRLGSHQVVLEQRALPNQVIRLQRLLASLSQVDEQGHPGHHDHHVGQCSQRVVRARQLIRRGHRPEYCRNEARHHPGHGHSRSCRPGCFRHMLTCLIQVLVFISQTMPLRIQVALRRVQRRDEPMHFLQFPQSGGGEVRGHVFRQVHFEAFGVARRLIELLLLRRQPGLQAYQVRVASPPNIELCEQLIADRGGN